MEGDQIDGYMPQTLEELRVAVWLELGRQGFTLQQLQELARDYRNGDSGLVAGRGE